MDWVWWAFDELIGTLLGTIIATFASLLTGLSCLVGSEAGCRNFPGYFDGLTTVAPKFIGLAAVCFVLLRPRASIRAVQGAIAWLHYFFVPHPAESAINAGRRFRTPQKIDPKAVVDAMRQDASFDRGAQHLPPAYQSESKRKRAEKLREAAEADRKLLEKLTEREWARRIWEKAKRGEL